MNAIIGRGTRRTLAKVRASNRGTRSLLLQARCGLYGADDRLALKAMALSRALDAALAEIGKKSAQQELRAA